jgi:hypothetical protein
MSHQEAPLLVDTLATLDADPGTPVEPVRARRYRHPVLGERPVVRLVGETAAPGEDGTLAFLGFEPPVASEPLARAPRRGLGFPQWVLLNDPARAGEALAVVEDMERAAHLARTKPGRAKDLYEVLARRLPHAHLPSFWEQAGRAFLATDRRRHAATMFEKAREAERVYGLATHDAAHRAVFLEFARAGALPAKSLARTVTELRRRHPPEDAYEAFLELALGRARGGLPPWTDLPEQARRLALHAGRDPAAEGERLLDGLLVLPATRRASAGFWRHGRAPLIRMARASAAVRGTLLNLLPEPDYEGDFDGWWLDLLDESGALDALILPADQCRRSRHRRGARGAGSLVSSSARSVTGGAAVRRRPSSSRWSRAWRHACGPMADRWRSRPARGAAATRSTRTSSTSSPSTASPSPTSPPTPASTCASGCRAARTAGCAGPWSTWRPTGASGRC